MATYTQRLHVYVLEAIGQRSRSLLPHKIHFWPFKCDGLRLAEGHFFIFGTNIYLEAMMAIIINYRFAYQKSMVK